MERGEKEHYMIDYENDYLVIVRKAGEISYFSWFESGSEINEILRVFSSEPGESAELVTDSLVREICAYWNKIFPFATSIVNYMDALKSTRTVVSLLEDALDSMKDIPVEVPRDEEGALYD
jgi:hypothetical protein